MLDNDEHLRPILTCVKCDQTNETVELIANPYELDVHGVTDLEQLCETCYIQVEESI